MSKQLKAVVVLLAFASLLGASVGAFVIGYRLIVSVLP